MHCGNFGAQIIRFVPADPLPAQIAVITDAHEFAQNGAVIDGTGTDGAEAQFRDICSAVYMDMYAADLDAFDVPDPGEDDLGGEA